MSLISPTLSQIPCCSYSSASSSQRLLENVKWVSRRGRIHAKSADTDEDTGGLETQLSSNGGNQSASFLSVLCPLLKLFSGGDPSQERNFTFEVYPCPKGSVRHRELVQRLGGKEQFPFLIDPNTGTSMYESGEIVKYLFQQYGKGRKPSVGLLESTLFTGWMPTIFRAGRGMTLWEKARLDSPPNKLELYSYENNPYARIVREALCELELPYILQNVGEGSLRSKLPDGSGSKEVPYLIDPNTGTQVGDYKKILSYLFQTYSAASV